MRIEFGVQGDAAETLRELAKGRLANARREMVRAAMVEALLQTIRRNPVDTGRSRAAWASSLEELGGTLPAGWEGPHPSAIDEGRRLGQLKRHESASSSEMQAVSEVSYLPKLEYGTSRMAPFAMVRSSLAMIAGRLREMFHLS